MKYRVGVDIGGTKTVIGLVDDHGNVVQKTKFNTADIMPAGKDPVQNVSTWFRDFCAQFNVPLSSLWGATLGIPGIIDRTSQKIESCPNLRILEGLAFGPALTDALQLPVWVENDVNLIALGEHGHGQGKGIADVAYIYVGTGIGCGLIINNRLHTGATGAAGEFGHQIIEPEGLPCECGNRGCLELYCSGKALSRLASHSVGGAGERFTAAADLIQAAQQQDQAAIEILDRAFTYLAYGVANLLNLINPGMVVLGGGILTGWPQGRDQVKEVFSSRIRKIFYQQLAIEAPLLGQDAGLIGAADYVDEMLKNTAQRS
ncbi:MAG: ROK family protein [Chloroflexi bacterium]|nr:ROK family protein [Chloroflexota bacterium]